MKRFILIFIGLALVGSTFAGQRSYLLGLADNHYDITAEAIITGWGYIANDADMIVYHDDRDGLPWTEAYWDLEYPAEFQGRINSRKSAQAHLWNTHKRYLAVSPLNFMRDNIADQFNAEQHPEWQAFWQSQPLNSEVVKIAYYKHLSRMIEVYQPHYLTYAVEANIFINKQHGRWHEFVELADYIYTRLKQDHPQLKTMISFQAEEFYKGFDLFDAPYVHYQSMKQVFPFTDFMPISSYPYTLFNKPEDMPEDYFTAIADLAPNKPLVIAETGWPAETLRPYFQIDSNAWKQRNYWRRVMNDIQSRNGEFIISLLPRDYDAIWEKVFKFEPDALLLRLWRDMGLYAGDGTVRPAARLWKQRLKWPIASPDAQ